MMLLFQNIMLLNQIKLHTLRVTVPAALNQLKTTVFDGARSISTPAVVFIIEATFDYC